MNNSLSFPTNVNKRQSSYAKISSDETMFFLEIPESFYTMTGFTRLEIEILFDNCLSKMISGGDAGALYDSMIRQLDLYKSAELTFSLPCKDKLEFTVLMLVHPEENGSQLYCMFSDVTPYKELSDACCAVKRESSAIADGIPGGMLKIACDGAFTVLYANRNIFRLSGYTRKEYQTAFGGSVLGALLPEDASLLKEQFINACKNQEPIEGETRIRHRNGSLRWISYYGNYFGMQGGFPVYLCIVLDINSHKLDSIQKLQSRRMLEHITATVQCGIVQYAVSPELKMTYANDAFYALTGYSREEFHSVDPKIIFPQHKEGDDDWEIHRLRAGKSAEIRYRIVKKDGSAAWLQMNAAMIKNTDGEEIIQAVFTDVTKMHNMQEELQLEKERYEIILSSTDSIIFRYDISRDFMQIFSSENSAEDSVSRRIEYPNYLKFLKSSSLVHPDDLEKLMPIYKGCPFTSLEARFEKPGFSKGKYFWFLLQGAVLKDDKGKPLEVVGVMREIDEQKKAEAQLMVKAQQDSLTKLYNKASVQALVEKRLAESEAGEIHAMMIIDIDDFKSINDSLGHWLGDTVLTDISSRLKKLFRSSDIVGRIGGDEFAVFLSGVHSLNVVKEKAEAVCNIFRNTYIGENSGCKISGSIGVALYPQHGKTYSQLFKSADRALYNAKRKGKDGYRVYSSASAPLFQERSYEPERAQTGDMDSHIKIRSSLVMDIFEMLLEARDIELAIPIILKVLSNHMDIDRAAIYELAPDEGSLSNTFEWCRNGMKNSKKFLTTEQYQKFGRMFDADGIFYCSNIDELYEKHPPLYRILKDSDVRSTLQFYMTENGAPFAIYSFDDFVNNRLWTSEEIITLKMICKALSTYLVKWRTQKQYQQDHVMLRTLASQKKIQGFIVDPESYEIYHNEKYSLARPIVKNDRLYCYQLLAQRTRPCSECPMTALKKYGAVSGFCKFAPKPVTEANGTVCRITWHGKEMALFSVCEKAPEKE